MPYKSAAQAAYMHIHEPKIAARWDQKYGGVRPTRRKVARQGAPKLPQTPAPKVPGVAAPKPQGRRKT